MFSAVRYLAVAATSRSLTSASTASPWSVDPAHTRIGFSVRHFFTPVQGQFDDFSVSLFEFGVGSGSWAETAVVGKDGQIQLQVEAAER